jgi:hypothetical protein
MPGTSPGGVDGPLREALWWHPLHTRDAGHIWLRVRAARVGASIQAMDAEHTKDLFHKA